MAFYFPLIVISDPGHLTGTWLPRPFDTAIPEMSKIRYAPNVLLHPFIHFPSSRFLSGPSSLLCIIPRK